MKNLRLPFCMTLAVGLFTLTTPAFALLPPLYTSLNQYKVLLTSPQLTEKLDSGELIQDIKRTDAGFIIKTNKNTLKVDVEYDKQQMPGPARFRLNFHDAVPLKNEGTQPEDISSHVEFEEETKLD